MNALERKRRFREVTDRIFQTHVELFRQLALVETRERFVETLREVACKHGTVFKTMVFVCAFICGSASCQQPNDASSMSASECDAACTNLSKLGCVDGNPGCVSLCERIQSSGYLKLDTACVIQAKTKSAATQCGNNCN